jgi:tetratricopeptide (TPR) repeat protein
MDPSGGLGLAVLARILHDVSGDHLATLGDRRALLLGLPAEEAKEVERGHRIDLWSRGLLAHRQRQSLLPASAFDDPTSFEPTPEHDAWLEARAARWGGLEGASLALRRLVGALSDALEVPTDAPDPLRAKNAWPDMPAFAAWKAEDPLSRAEPPLDPEDLLGRGEVTVISDAWTAARVEALEARGHLSEAIEIAERWAELRPARIRPRVALLRLLLRRGDAARAREVEAELLASDTEDLNELEEARVGLGLLERFEAQLAILDRMDRLAPGHPVILANRGAVALELGDVDAAERDLQLALQLAPESGPALTNLALLRMQEGAHAVARGLLEQAKLLHPEETQIRCYLATCLAELGQEDAARREARAAVDADPEHGPSRELLARLS